ncbi:MFS transporter [Gymnodinialimonas ceratoperidinii]|uniref:MFS transporter n=1 Tax=Gymnodinialimonas ceratoperidinii TaxID=2856823 RepID=UPI001FFC9912|nr:MFS transporter [Gymnodinialimonas ceratoperidinii]
MDASSHRTPWLLIAALYLTGLIAGMQFTKVSLTLTGLAEVYPGWPVAFAVSGVAVMGILFGVMAGGFTASIGPRRAILLALGTSAIVGGVEAFLPPFPVFMALRVIEGAGHLVLVVAVPTLMARLAAPKDRAMVMGLWATFFGVGFAAAALTMGDNLSAAYGGHAIFAAIMFGVLFTMLPKGVVVVRRPLPRLSDHLMIYQTPRLFAPGLGHGIYASLFLALVTFMPLALDALWLAPILPLAGILGSFLAGFLARWIAPGTLVWGTFLTMAILFAITLVSGPAAPYVLIVALGASGIVAGAGFAAVPWLNAADDDRALANGALAQLGNIGTFTGTPVLAAMATGAYLPVAIGVSLVAAAVTYLAYRAARS